ncbi:MAG: riboflavin synthase [Spirochaetaceae bacterium]|nr:MAG: riboflavin synthase [Spirochaetaceae bacterium]
MFTGLIEETGSVAAVRPVGDGVEIEINAQLVIQDANIGDSISVNGVCQTVVRLMDHSFTVQAVGETLTKTTMGVLAQGSPVHLERSMRADTRMGGHMVQGHVSGLGEVVDVTDRGTSILLRIRLPEALLPLVVPEGSVALDGVSLTVASIEQDIIGINIVPHTAAHTHLTQHQPGDRVNVETDILGRYVERMFRVYAGALGGSK